MSTLQQEMRVEKKKCLESCGKESTQFLNCMTLPGHNNKSSGPYQVLKLGKCLSWTLHHFIIYVTNIKPKC